MLPSTSEGLALIGHARGSLLARLEVEGKAQSCAQMAFRLRDGTDEICALLVEDLCQGSVCRRVRSAS